MSEAADQAGADTAELERLKAAFFDTARLRQLQREIDLCGPEQPPRARLFPSIPPTEAQTLAVLPGSFNPLTLAHVALAEAAERDGLGGVLFLLATRIVDKEQVEGALLVDRLLSLLLHAEREPRRTVALVNRGLFVDQAELLRAELPRLRRLTFVVGFDKIVQVLDSRYYADRQTALDRLFGLASFVVAPRAGEGATELRGLLETGANRPYADRIQPLSVPSELAEVASSRVRTALAEGGEASLDLPVESLALIEATGCYRLNTGGADGGLQSRYIDRRRALLR
jgi:nicotinic acid mononucleotide adenylyltransferase